jgi:hypothetical protein
MGGWLAGPAGGSEWGAFQEQAMSDEPNLFDPPSPPPFSVECFGLGGYGCDPGDHLGSQDEAESEGWTQIELILEAEASPMANYRGLCPICSAIEAKGKDDREARERIKADRGHLKNIS